MRTFFRVDSWQAAAFWALCAGFYSAVAPAVLRCLRQPGRRACTTTIPTLPLWHALPSRRACPALLCRVRLSKAAAQSLLEVLDQQSSGNCAYLSARDEAEALLALQAECHTAALRLLRCGVVGR